MIGDLIPGTTIQWRPLPIDDPKRRQPDVSRALAELGWSPTTDLAEGLARTVAYFRSIGVGA